MEWKKVQLSAAELERRRQEYLRDAMSMMKRSHSAAQKNSVSQPEDTLTAEVVRTASVQDIEDPAEEAAEQVNVEVPDDKDTIAGPDKAEEVSEESFDKEQESDESADEKYGVFTAGEIMNKEYKDEGLKKAAEILEEMTKNAEMMKKLANGDDDSDGDTTDFPVFSCDGEEVEEGIFREDCSPEEDQPREPEMSGTQ